MLLFINDFNKLILKQIIILIPKYKENMLSFLAPVIGIYGIKINLFIEDFDNKTENIDIDIIIPVNVTIYKINTFDLEVKLPYISYFLNEFYQNMSTIYLYKISFIKSINNLKFIKQNYKLLRSYINSINKVKNFFNLIKFNFFIIKEIQTFQKFKYLIKNYYYKYEIIKYNYSIFLNINNYNFKILKNNFNFIKISKTKNIFLFKFFNFNNLILFYKQYYNIKIKNKYSFLFIKYKSNILVIKFFKNILLYYYNNNVIFNILKYLFLKFYNIFPIYKFLFTFKK